MSKIRNSKPKKTSGGFQRLVGNDAMAEIFTKVQSTVISNGTELERIISKMSNTINDLDAFIESCRKGTAEDGVYLCTKKVVKASQFKLEKHEPDFIVFTVEQAEKNCYVVELKDGDEFDTKKSEAEKTKLKEYAEFLGCKIPFITNSYICCFNQSDKDVIVNGFKKEFSKEEVMTGRELCEILRIDYDAIVNMRKNDTADNFEFVLEKMFEIKEVREYFAKHIS